MAGADQKSLLLIGGTGKGKSSLGNSLLKQKCFKVSMNKSSETQGIDFGFGKHGNTTIKVVDCMGIGDTRIDSSEDKEKVQECLQAAISASPIGYHAILLVDTFGSRCVENDLSAVDLLKRLLGPEFITKYCIIVMTRGDEFERKQEDEETDITFDEWCQQEKELDAKGFGKLLEECNDRVLLFDNVTKDEVKKTHQIDVLLEMINDLPTKGQRYTNEHFKQAEENRKKTVKAEEWSVQENIIEKVDLIGQKIKEFLELKDDQRKLALREKISAQCQVLLIYIDKKDRGTGVYKKIKGFTKDLQNSIETKPIENAQIKEKMSALENEKSDLKVSLISYWKSVRKGCLLGLGSGVVAGAAGVGYAGTDAAIAFAATPPGVIGATVAGGAAVCCVYAHYKQDDIKNK